MKRLLITGSSGRIGSTIVSGLSAKYRLRLFDVQPPDVRLLELAGPETEVVVSDINEVTSITAACDGIDCLIHLAGIPEEAEFEPILDANIRGVYHVMEAARLANVPRVLFASTNHVIGFYPTEREVGADDPPRPDTFYAASKVYGEALARLYHDKYGIEIVVVRIGSFRPRPGSQRELSTWLSPDDAIRLFAACIEAPEVGFKVVFGVSANSANLWRDDAATSIGYHPRDSADSYRGGSLTADSGDQFHGGAYTDPEHIGGFPTSR